MAAPASAPAKIRAFGAYLPDRIVDNAEIGRLCGAEPDWIRQQTGIEQRRWAAEGQTVAAMAVLAARDCLANAGPLSSGVGLILVSSGTSERRFPGPASTIAADLGLSGIPAIDLPIASAGSLFGLALAAEFASRYGNVLVIGAEAMSRVIIPDPAHRDTAILFGDGAGACLVSMESGFAAIRDSLLATDGDFAEILRLDLDAPIFMDGRAVIMQVARKLPRSIQDLLDRNAHKPQEIAAYLLHQANLNLIAKVAKTLGVEESRFFCNLHRYGNTSSASLLIAAAEWRQANPQLSGPLVLAAFGAGLNWGAILADPCS